MSLRFQSFEPRFNGKGPNGRRLCVWCGNEVPKNRRNWCSQECVTAMQIEHWPAEWRRNVLYRDGWICQVCGFNGRIVEAILHHLRWDHELDHYGNEQHMAAWRWYRQHLAELGFTPGLDYMQADHIVPIIEGGNNKLENGRTLCIPCHKSATAELARKRKLDRLDVDKLWSRPCAL
jgi:hypothetical protein